MKVVFRPQQAVASAAMDKRIERYPHVGRTSELRWQARRLPGPSGLRVRGENGLPKPWWRQRKRHSHIRFIATVARILRDTAPEWIVVDTHQVQLMAARNGDGSGRIYTITVTATNADGTSPRSTVEVVVPHDQGN